MGNKITAIKKYLKKKNPFRDPWDTDPDEPPTDWEEFERSYVPPPVTIVDRSYWGAKKPKWRQKLETPVSHYVMRFHSGTDYCWNDEECIPMLREIQEDHMRRGMPDIAWNFMIGCNGTVFEGRGWNTKPTKTDWETLRYDGQTIDVALLGDFNWYHPTGEMNSAMCRLMRKGVELGWATEGWELTEVADSPPSAAWTPEVFMKNDLPSERIYDDTTEPPPCAGGGGAPSAPQGR